MSTQATTSAQRVDFRPSAPGDRIRWKESSTTPHLLKAAVAIRGPRSKQMEASGWDLPENTVLCHRDPLCICLFFIGLPGLKYHHCRMPRQDWMLSWNHHNPVSLTSLHQTCMHLSHPRTVRGFSSPQDRVATVDPEKEIKQLIKKKLLLFLMLCGLIQHPATTASGRFILGGKTTTWLWDLL